MSVLVTGATGLLGSNVVRGLLAQGREVVAVVRDRERASRLLPRDGRLRLVDGDITNVDGFAPSLRDVDAVIHTAAYLREYLRPGFDAALMHRTNVTAVTDLLRAAAHADVAVLVHVSSISTVGPAPDGTFSDESTPPSPRQDPYHKTKLLAEAAIRDFCAAHELRVPIVLPGTLWGPGDAAPTATGRLFLAVAQGKQPAITRVGSHMVDARDVASACIRATADGVSLRRYIVGGVRRTIDEVCAEIARATGTRPPRVLPSRASLPLATLVELEARLRRRPAPVTRMGARVLLERDRVRISSARAQSELGVAFRPLAETVADEALWFRERGLL